MTFASGQVVTYRELWDDRVMTAIPLYVVEDGPDLTVLYLRAETAFHAGRAPGGGPIQDLDNWVSVPATWSGGSLIRLLPAKLWFCIDLEFDADKTFAGYYVNFQRPAQRTASGFDTVDLVLDLMVAPNGEARVKDAEDFAAAVAEGHIDPEVAHSVRSEMRRIRNLFDKGDIVLGADHWKGWQPPDDWGVPVLEPRWQEIGR